MNMLKYSAIALALASVLQPVQAEDIELYVNKNVNEDEKPRVILVFDTSGSMDRNAQTGKYCDDGCNSRMDVAKSAMSQLINDNSSDIDFGLMRLRSSYGGYVLAGLGTDADTIKSEISKLSADGSTPIEETLYEGYRYLTGGRLDQARYVESSKRETSIEQGSRGNYKYTSAFAAYANEERCDNSINMILMTDGDPTGDNARDGYDDGDSYIKGLHESKFHYRASELHGSSLHILAKYMYGLESGEEDDKRRVDLYPQTPLVKDFARTYTIGFGNGMSKKGKELLQKTAKLGGGEYIHAETGDKLSEALENTISKIREVNDTFTSPAIASNNFDRTRSRDSLYYAMFYPDEGTRWSGNIKKLKVNGEEVIDANNNNALESSSGTIKKNARTFWLPSTESDDGAVVHRGGTNGALVRKGSRTVYTDTGGVLTPFDFTKMVDALGGGLKGETALKDLFDVSDNSEVQALINWSIGYDIDDEDEDANTTEFRQSVMGDPLHSKPVAIDYGGDIRILVGTNAGHLHMFQDNEQNNSVTENWSFIPSELFDIVEPLRDNESGKEYGMDGPISIHFDDVNGNGIVESGDKVWAFIGMRRGGNSYYALDISKKDAPKLMWRISSTDSSFAELGQSWSRMEVVHVNHKTYKGPLLAFGGGYDTNKDAALKSTDSKGVGLFLVDAESGDLVWKLTPSTGFGGSHSIAANISYLDSDYDGYIDRFYAADTGGDVWRIDMPSDDPKSAKKPWTHFKLASFGGVSTTADRRFFYQPMVARTYFSKVVKTEVKVGGKTTTQLNRQDTPYDAILLGSGNRSKPTGTAVSDALFMIRDEHTATQSFVDNIPAAISLSDLMPVNGDPFTQALDSKDDFMELEYKLGNNFKGWYYNMDVGEKSLAAPTVIGGVAYFSSFTPASKDSIENQCSLGGGTGAVYAFHLHYGAAVYNSIKINTGDSIPDTPTTWWTKNDDGKSEMRIVLPNGVLDPKVIQGPIPKVVDGKIQLYSDMAGVGLKTQQTYIYRLEDNRDKH